MAHVPEGAEELLLLPIAYVTLTLFLVISGFVFFLIFSDLARQTSMGMGYEAVNAPQLVTRYYFGWLSTILLFLVPLITMGVYAEEKKKGTYELLFTSPLYNLQIIFGKFLANLVFCLVLFAGSALLMTPLFLTAAPDPGPTLVAYLGLVLFAAGHPEPGQLPVHPDRKPDHRRHPDVRVRAGALVHEHFRRERHGGRSRASSATFRPCGTWRTSRRACWIFPTSSTS